MAYVGHGFVIAMLLGMAATPSIAQDPEAAYKALGATASAPLATIHYGSDPLQVGDLRVPPGRGPFPVAVIIHGGCWRATVDNRGSIAGLADALGKRGFATWNIEYRRIGNAGGGWPGTFEDVAAATDKLAAIAPRYKLDLKHVILVGHSSGAHLALWDASRPKLPAPWSHVAIHPTAVVAIDGPGSLAPFIGIDAEACGQPVIVPLMGGTPKDKPNEYRIASPADHLPLGIHQILIGADFAALMRPYAAAAKASGDTVDVLEPANANHFDIVTPGTSSGDAVVAFIASKAFDPPKP